SGLALVRERRRVVLPAGDVLLRYEDVPVSIQPDSVRLQILSAPGAVRIGERSFQSATLSPRGLLHAYIGKQLLLTEDRRVDGHEQQVQVPATLVSDSDGYVWRIHGHLVVLPAAGAEPAFEVQRLPAGLYTRPTVVWRLHTRRAGPEVIETEYLARKLSWRAEYVLKLAAAGHRGSLSAAITVVNDSGQAFPGAQLRLVAGQVHGVQPPPGPLPQQFAVAAARPLSVAAPPSVTARRIFAYHLYTVRRPVTLAAPGDDAIPWLPAVNIPVRKTYVVYGAATYLSPMQRAGQGNEEPVAVELAFANTAADGLGRALPAGAVRIYEPVAEPAGQPVAEPAGQPAGAANGGPVFLGAANLPDTPAGDSVRLQVGQAFDLRARRIETSFRMVKPQVYEASYRITLRNSTRRPVRIQDDEQFRGSWTILRASQRFTQPSASTARFPVAVPAHAMASFTYTVQETY
ncbi:MAG: DUF4139 domain-containing protein, partial [Terriglobales bacterium]